MRSLKVIVGLAFICNLISAKPSMASQKWDQDEAVRRVQNVVAQENAGNFAWNNIDWITDPEVAAAKAQAENKPLILYFFLKGTVGPPAAPC